MFDWKVLFAFCINISINTSHLLTMQIKRKKNVVLLLFFSDWLIFLNNMTGYKSHCHSISTTFCTQGVECSYQCDHLSVSPYIHDRGKCTFEWWLLFLVLRLLQSQTRDQQPLTVLLFKVIPIFNHHLFFLYCRQGDGYMEDTVPRRLQKGRESLDDPTKVGLVLDTSTNSASYSVTGWCKRGDLSA